MNRTVPDGRITRRCHWFPKSPAMVQMTSLVLVLAAFPQVAMSADDPGSIDEFEKRVRPLLIQRCGECHSTDKAEDNGHLALDGPAGLRAGGTRGPAFIAGKPDESLLIRAVRYIDPQLQMPPGGKLPAEEIQVLTRWISAGAALPADTVAAGKRTRIIDWRQAREFWSFRPVTRPALPSVAGAPATTLAEPRNPVDTWLAVPRDARGLPKAPEADRRTLLRRLSFDLVGLPPTSEDVDEFAVDPRPDAYERAVDRLLASPRFGERWARYWLDLVRYVDFTPDWQKTTVRAWLYRDWIVRALNEDRPFDEFVRMQLAADLVPDANPQDLAALGMLGVSPTYWKELKLAPSVIEVIVADEWDERLDTVMRTFLGLTVACARCHDHKFDPVTMQDYYALAGVFASTQVADRPLLPAAETQQVLAARAQVDRWQADLKKIQEQESEAARSLRQQIDALRAATPDFEIPFAPVVEDSSVYVMPNGPDATRLEYRKPPRDLPVFRRGNPANPGDIVPRRFLQVFSPEAAPFQVGSGRLELAHALLTQAGGLAARVHLNRLWMFHFGRPLVRTPGDFGQQGERPTHPELLEWLASELVQAPGQAWESKRLHRMLVNSAAYRQVSSHPQASVAAADPDNVWLARMNRRRLDVEPWRDAMLAACGNLDDRMAGPSSDLSSPQHFRRTLYGGIGRDEQDDLLRTFDFPPPNAHSPARDATTTPLQQLFVFNSAFVDRQAAALAAELLAEPHASTVDRIDASYRRLFQRRPSSTERSQGERFLSLTDGSEAERWRWYVQSLLGLNEFLYVD